MGMEAMLAAEQRYISHWLDIIIHSPVPSSALSSPAAHRTEDDGDDNRAVNHSKSTDELDGAFCGDLKDDVDDGIDDSDGFDLYEKNVECLKSKSEEKIILRIREQPSG